MLKSKQEPIPEPVPLGELVTQTLSDVERTLKGYEDLPYDVAKAVEQVVWKRWKTPSGYTDADARETLAYVCGDDTESLNAALRHLEWRTKHVK